jgi:hypothetical protein
MPWLQILKKNQENIENPFLLALPDAIPRK